MNPDIEMDPRLQAYVDGVKQQTTSKQNDEAMQRRLMDSIDDYTERHQEPGENTNGSFTRGFGFLSNLSSASKIVYAGSVATACVLVVGLFLSSSVTSPAFASVVQKLSEITSMHYQGLMRSNGQDMMKIEVFYHAPSKLRVVTAPLRGGVENSSMINVLDTELGKGVILMPQAKMAMPFEFSPNADINSPEQDPLHWLDTIMNYQGEVDILEPAQILGHQAVGYVIVEPGMTITLWADIETNLPVQFRLQMDERNGQSPFEFIADVQFNQELDEALFSLRPEADYQMRSED